MAHEVLSCKFWIISIIEVNRYYHTDWVPENELQFHIDRLSIDAVYENLARQIAGDVLSSTEGETLQESVA